MDNKDSVSDGLRGKIGVREKNDFVVSGSDNFARNINYLGRIGSLEKNDILVTTNAVFSTGVVDITNSVKSNGDCENDVKFINNNDIFETNGNCISNDGDFESMQSVDIEDSYSKKIQNWSVEEVCDWLVGMEMPHHVMRFHDSQVDGEMLVGLGRGELIRLGVDKVGERMELERAVKRILMTQLA